jgi:hypothetical protein
LLQCETPASRNPETRFQKDFKILTYVCYKRSTQQKGAGEQQQQGNGAWAVGGLQVLLLQQQQQQ